MDPTTPPAPPPRRGERLAWCLLVFGTALGARLLHLGQLRGSPLFEILMGDSRSYDAWALRIAAGDWLGSEVFYQAPLYPYFLAAVYGVIGHDVFAVRVVQAVLGAGSCMLLALAVWRLLSKPAGVAAGLLLALYGPAIFADTTIQKSVLVVFLLCLSLWLLAGVATRAHPRPAACVGLGAAVGALVLARENALVLLPVLAPWLLLVPQAKGIRRLLPAALFATGAALVLLPVALRNLHVGGELHLTTSQLGPNLFIGNNAAADGTYAPLLPGRGDPRYERDDARAVAERALGRELTPSEVSRFFVGQVLHYVRSQPGDWLALMARKLALAFNAIELVDTEDLYTHAESSLPLRWAAAVLHFGVIAPLALVGLWLTRAQRTRLLPLYGMIVAYAASLVAFYVFARYRLPLAVLLLPFAAAALVALPRLPRDRRLAVLAAVVAAAAVACNWPVVERDRMRSVTRYNLGNEHFAAGAPEAAEREYREAIRLRADNVQAHNNLGVVLAARGDLAGARAAYEAALRITPSYVDARVNLARTLHETGETRAAIAEYEHALRIAPERADLHEELAAVYAESGDDERARESRERAQHLRARGAAGTGS